jgi:hypothetical protein
MNILWNSISFQSCCVHSFMKCDNIAWLQIKLADLHLFRAMQLMIHGRRIYSFISTSTLIFIYMIIYHKRQGNELLRTSCNIIACWIVCVFHFTPTVFRYIVEASFYWWMKIEYLKEKHQPSTNPPQIYYVKYCSIECILLWKSHTTVVICNCFIDRR